MDSEDWADNSCGGKVPSSQSAFRSWLGAATVSVTVLQPMSVISIGLQANSTKVHQVTRVQCIYIYIVWAGPINFCCTFYTSCNILSTKRKRSAFLFPPLSNASFGSSPQYQVY